MIVVLRELGHVLNELGCRLMPCGWEAGPEAVGGDLGSDLRVAFAAACFRAGARCRSRARDLKRLGWAGEVWRPQFVLYQPVPRVPWGFDRSHDDYRDIPF